MPRDRSARSSSSAEEGPAAVQLAGTDPALMAEAARDAVGMLDRLRGVQPAPGPVGASVRPAVAAAAAVITPPDGVWATSPTEGGAWRLAPVLAQGCRPIGPVFEVEQAQRNVVIEVSRGSDRRSPVAALQAILTELSPTEREST